MAMYQGLITWQAIVGLWAMVSKRASFAAPSRGWSPKETASQPCHEAVMLSRKITPSDADSYSVNKQRKQIQLLSHSLKVFLGNGAVKPSVHSSSPHTCVIICGSTLENVCLVIK